MCSGVFRMTMKTIWLIAGLLILSTVASEAAPPANSTVAPGKSAAAQTRKKIDYGLVSVERVFGDDAKEQRGTEAGAGLGPLEHLRLTDTLQVNDTVITGAATSVIIRLGDGSKVNIGYASEFVILPEEGKGSALAAGFRPIARWGRPPPP